MSLYAGITHKQAAAPATGDSASTASGSASPAPALSASPAPPEAADKPKSATWSAALRFAPVARKKATKPATSSIPSAFTAAFASAEESNAPAANYPRIVGPAKAALAGPAAPPPKGRFGSATSTAAPPSSASPTASSTSAAPTPAVAATPAPPQLARMGRTLARPPPMTLDDEEDVNGFKQTSMGKRAEKRKAHVVGQGKRGRKGGDPALAFGDTPYEPSKPCDYSAYKAHLQALRTQRRLEQEERRRRERSPSGSSYESESEGERSDAEQAAKKPRFFAPPTSYDDPPTFAAPPSFTSAPPPPAFTPDDGSSKASAIPREETGEEAYLRRLAMSSKPAAPEPPRPAYPSFAPATQAPSFVGSASTPSFYPSATPPAPPAFAPASQSAPPPPPPPGFIPPTFFAPPGVGPDDFPPFQPTAADWGGQQQPAPAPAPPANAAIADAQAKAREIAQRLSKLQGLQPPAPVGVVGAPAVGDAAGTAGPVQPKGNEEPDNRPFADRMMSKFGWTQGKGLGASEDGMSTALSVARAAPALSKKAAAKAKAAGVAPPAAEPQSHGMAGSRAKVVDSTREARLAKEREERGGDPSRVVLLTNLCGREEVDDDLGGEVAEEANKFGVVERCFVYPVPGEERDDEAVRIFLVMSGLAGGYNAVRQFNGRFFGGRTVKARFYDESAFNAGQHRL